MEAGPPPLLLPASPDPALDGDVAAVSRARAALVAAHRARLAAWVAALPADAGEVGAAWEGVAVLAGA
jgi:hypothetical protein